MSAIGPLSKAKRTSASDCRTIAIYEYTPLEQNAGMGQHSFFPALVRLERNM
jgi:hypothetical protein